MLGSSSNTLDAAYCGVEIPTPATPHPSPAATHAACFIWYLGERLGIHLANGRSVFGDEGTDLYAHGCSSAVWKLLTKNGPYRGNPEPER
jgi:hypothetical protein